jgi:hypothetical protein
MDFFMTLINDLLIEKKKQTIHILIEFFNSVIIGFKSSSDGML